MRKLIPNIFIIILLLSFIGCQNDRKVSFGGKAITKITISKFKYFGFTNEEVLVSFSKPSEIKLITNSIDSAKQLEGWRDVAEAHYDINIVFEDTSSKGYHLWLYEDTGMLMNIDNTLVVYSLKESSVKKLKEVLLDNER